MTTAELTTYAIDVTDIEYLRHGDKPLLARLYKPRGTGPFPIIVDLHGGAWCKKDRMSDAGTDEPLAKSGVIVVALDFRMPPDAGYPASLADVNYAIRWCKAHAAEWNGRADRVGVLGVSSGGHQAMLAAMRPADMRYAALPLAGKSAVDAKVHCAVMCWPVIDPLGRYQYAKAAQKGNDEKLKKSADEWVICHDKYWGSEAAMTEGNPTLALERGEKTDLPPVLYLQGTADIAHPKPNRDQFIASYRKAGGRVDLHLFEGVGEAFITNDPTSQAARDAIERIVEFVHREMQ
ncbi:MAG TPA: alpha/beta hydrolase [Casimicrobiaceae bacterium]|jgi:acetyl esterase|nr:alpha/beta hydrolase [Casimicrobiaceae bacterium]